MSEPTLFLILSRPVRSTYKGIVRFDTSSPVIDEVDLWCESYHSYFSRPKLRRTMMEIQSDRQVRVWEHELKVPAKVAGKLMKVLSVVGKIRESISVL